MTKREKAKRDKEFAKQRKTRGWDDSETWSLDNTIAKFVLPRLKRFKEVNGGTPFNLTAKEWNKILDQMIKAFEIYARGAWDMKDKEVKIAEKGMMLFSKHFGELWW